MPAPVIYYVRHGLTDWNLQQRLQGRHDIPLNADGCKQAIRCAAILQDLFVRDGRAPASLDYISSPLVRARKTMEIMRMTLGLDSADYSVDARLAEIAFGEWEGLTYAEVVARDGDVIARRESHKWDFRPPGGESYAQVTIRIRKWYETIARDTVVAAHGGTARALIAHLGLAAPEEATHYSIDQGVVYVFAGSVLGRYG
ncbi:MAG TPA: histidine phosphatase family protein [Xanthobacteraceae bacterium]